MNPRSRLTSTQHSPAAGGDQPARPAADRLQDLGRLVLAGVVLGWLTIAVLTLRHPIFVTHDSLISYAHSWWIQSRLWHGHGIPWRMPVLGHGHALTYPYGTVPWTVAALLWPLAGERAVTIVLVVGALGLIVSTFWAFPETRRPWYAAGVLVNPILVVAPLSGQVPFLWASALLMGAIGCWRRDLRAWAVVLAGIGQLCHPAVVLPIAAALVLARLRWEPHRRALLACYALSLCIALPGVWAVVSSPVFVDSSWQTRIAQFLETVSVRACVFAAPLLALLVLRYPRRFLPPVLVGLTVLLNLVLLHPLDAAYAWTALAREPDNRIFMLLHSPEFRPGATYRMLPSHDGRVGMYELIRSGGRLDSEFFPESIWFGDFADERAYSTFLVGRDVDYIVLFYDSDSRHRTNERLMITRLAVRGGRCLDGLVGIRLVQHHDGWDVFYVDRSCVSLAGTGVRSGGGP